MQPAARFVLSMSIVIKALAAIAPTSSQKIFILFVRECLDGKLSSGL